MKDNNNFPARNIANEEQELTVKIRHMLLLNPLMDFKVVKHAYNSVAELKLADWGIEIDHLSPEQQAYLYGA